MTLKLWLRYYQCYKDDFDLEMRMKEKNITYTELTNPKEVTIDDVIPI